MKIKLSIYKVAFDKAIIPKILVSSYNGMKRDMLMDAIVMTLRSVNITTTDQKHANQILSSGPTTMSFGFLTSTSMTPYNWLVFTVYTTCRRNRLWALILQNGFLHEQGKSPTDGKRDLKYDVADGMFTLSTDSYAQMKCDMKFSLYPFDTQRCPFAITTKRNLTYQGEN